MAKCNLHNKNDAKKVCAKCGKTFCDDCAKQTDYTGFCVECEKTRQNTIAKYSLKKQVGYLSNTIACFVGAIIFLVLTVENGIKIKNAKKMHKKLCDVVSAVGYE